MSSSTKLLGDAGEHYALSLLSFAGKFAAKMPDNWKSYDLVVDDGSGMVRVSVKTRSQSEGWTVQSHYRFDVDDRVEWFVFILKHRNGDVRAWVIPWQVALAEAHQPKSYTKSPNLRRIPFRQLLTAPLRNFEDNWTLNPSPPRRRPPRRKSGRAAG